MSSNSKKKKKNLNREINFSWNEEEDNPIP